MTPKTVFLKFPLQPLIPSGKLLTKNAFDLYCSVFMYKLLKNLGIHHGQFVFLELPPYSPEAVNMIIALVCIGLFCGKI